MALTNARRFVPGALLVMVVALASGCSSDSKQPSVSSASRGSTASSSSPAMSSPPPSTESTPSTESASSTDPCIRGGTVPQSAINVSHAAGDFNGDGEVDTLTVYGTGTTTQPAPYHVRVDLAGTDVSADALIVDAATDDTQVVKALGGADITGNAGAPPDGSGAEAFVTTGSGASDTLVGVFQLVNCTLTRLTGPQGNAPSTFPIGGSVTHLDGLRCDGTAGEERLVQLSATSDDGITYTTKETRLTVENGHLTPDAPVTDTISADDPRLQPFSTLNCPGVQAP